MLGLALYWAIAELGRELEMEPAAGNESSALCVDTITKFLQILKSPVEIPDDNSHQQHGTLRHVQACRTSTPVNNGLPTLPEKCERSLIRHMDIAARMHVGRGKQSTIQKLCVSNL